MCHVTLKILFLITNERDTTYRRPYEAPENFLILISNQTELNLQPDRFDNRKKTKWKHSGIKLEIWSKKISFHVALTSISLVGDSMSPQIALFWAIKNTISFGCNINDCECWKWNSRSVVS